MLALRTARFVGYSRVFTSNSSVYYRSNSSSSNLFDKAVQQSKEICKHNIQLDKYIQMNALDDAVSKWNNMFESNIRPDLRVMSRLVGSLQKEGRDVEAEKVIHDITAIHMGVDNPFIKIKREESQRLNNSNTKE